MLLNCVLLGGIVPETHGVADRSIHTRCALCAPGREGRDAKAGFPFRGRRPGRWKVTVHDPVVIVGFARTPMGGFQGDLKSVTAPALGAIAARGAMQRAGITPGDVDEVLLGCVLPAGQGQAPARQASMGAGIPQSIGAVTVN